MKVLDLSNKKFYKLTAIRQVQSRNNRTMWECICDCGNTTLVLTSNLTCGRVKSCGCLKNEKLINRNTIHNLRKTPIYEVWKTMKQRCFNPNNSSYKNYGGRGISVCEDWKYNFTSFYKWSMSNGYKKGLTIDRIDNNSNYCPENCRWVDRITQANNTRWNKLITIDGKVDTRANWLRYFNLDDYNFNKQLKLGLLRYDTNKD